MQREQVAREEAAHAAAAVRAGRRILHVSLDPPCCKIEYHCDYSLTDAVVRVVGPLAIDAWPPARLPAPLFDDRSAAELICEELAGSGMAATTLLDSAHDHAVALLQDPAFVAAVDSLARRLLRDGHVAGPEVETLLGVDRTAAPWRCAPTPPATAPWHEAASA
jgi:hypothetical protein